MSFASRSNLHISVLYELLLTASSGCVKAIMISVEFSKDHVLLTLVHVKNITSRFGEQLLYRSHTTSAYEVV
jgi:hypothetical protein